MIGAEARLIDGDRASENWLCLGKSIAYKKQAPETAKGRSNRRVIAAEAFFQNHKPTVIKRLGFFEPVHIPKQLCQIGESFGNIGVIGAEALFIDGKGAAKKWFCFGRPIRRPKHLSQLI